MNNTHTASVGIDVSKDKLDVCLLKANDKTVFKTVSNDTKGFKQMLAWIEHAAPAFELHYALEATGTYSNAVAQFLVQNDTFTGCIYRGSVLCFLPNIFHNIRSHAFHNIDNE